MQGFNTGSASGSASSSDIITGVSNVGTAFFVSTEGSDTNGGLSWDDTLLTIDAAVDKCTADKGDIIYIAPGTYDETVLGVVADVAGITIKGLTDANGSRVNITNSTGGLASTITVSANNITIENISVESSTTYGIWCSGSYCTLRNIFMLGGHADGIMLNAATYCTIEDVVGLDCTNDLIRLQAVSNYNIIQNCVIYGSTATGINIDASDRNTISNCTITSSGVTTSGVRLNNADYNIVNNTVTVIGCDFGTELTGTSANNHLFAEVSNCVNEWKNAAAESNVIRGRRRGESSVAEFSVTAAANAGVTVITSAKTKPCLVKSIVVHADAAQTADMTSCAIEGGTSQVIEFISSATAIQASLDATDKQVSWTGAVRLNIGSEITIDLQGTGATAVNLTITIEYEACSDDGYLLSD